jgi:hypothetical protein
MISRRFLVRGVCYIASLSHTVEHKLITVYKPIYLFHGSLSAFGYNMSIGAFTWTSTVETN